MKNEMTPENDVGAALTLLRDTLAEEAQRINGEGARAMQNADYKTAEAVLDFAKRLLAFRSKVEELVGQWDALEELRDAATTEVQEIVGKRFFGRSRKGEITPHTDFCRPILETLVELGGKGTTKAVLDRVGERMKGILKPKDFEPHESRGKQIRWRNSAQWARNLMANEDGRMKKTSRGTWEISAKGREWLEQSRRGAAMKPPP